jgi:hypothetical protein
VILDNGSSHVAKHTKAWFAAHPRWVVHYTPPHASWVNQVELFFSVLQRKVIANGSFTSRDDLIARLLGFIADYDQTATPFKWTYGTRRRSIRVILSAKTVSRRSPPVGDQVHRSRSRLLIEHDPSVSQLPQQRRLRLATGSPAISEQLAEREGSCVLLGLVLVTSRASRRQEY